MALKWQVFILTLLMCGVLCLASTSAKQNTATQRQGGAAAALSGSGILSTLGSMVPGVVGLNMNFLIIFIAISPQLTLKHLI
jgi:hypothetical protein